MENIKNLADLKSMQTMNKIEKITLTEKQYSKNGGNNELMSNEGLKPEILHLLTKDVVDNYNHISFDYKDTGDGIYIAEMPTVQERDGLNVKNKNQLYTSSAIIQGGFNTVEIHKDKKDIKFELKKIPNKDILFTLSKDKLYRLMLTPLKSLCTLIRSITLIDARISSNLIYVPVQYARVLALLGPSINSRFESYMINVGQLMTFQKYSDYKKGVKTLFDTVPAFYGDKTSVSILPNMSLQLNAIKKGIKNLNTLLNMFRSNLELYILSSSSGVYSQSSQNLFSNIKRESYPMEYAYNLHKSNNENKTVSKFGDLQKDTSRQYYYLYFMLEFFYSVMIPELEKRGWIIDYKLKLINHPTYDLKYSIRDILKITDELKMIKKEVKDTYDPEYIFDLMRKNDRIEKVNVIRYSTLVIYYKGEHRYKGGDNKSRSETLKSFSKTLRNFFSNLKPTTIKMENKIDPSKLYSKWNNIYKIINMMNIFKLNKAIGQRSLIQEMKKDFKYIPSLNSYILFNEKDTHQLKMNILIELKERETRIYILEVHKRNKKKNNNNETISKINEQLKVGYNIRLVLILKRFNKNNIRYIKKTALIYANKINQNNIKYKVLTSNEEHNDPLIKYNKINMNSKIYRYEMSVPVNQTLKSKLNNKMIKKKNKYMENPYITKKNSEEKVREINYKYLDIILNKNKNINELTVYDSKKDIRIEYEKDIDGFIMDILKESKYSKTCICILNIDEEKEYSTEHTTINTIYIKIIKALILNINVSKIDRITFINKSKNTQAINLVITLTNNNISKELKLKLININYIENLYPNIDEEDNKTTIGRIKKVINIIEYFQKNWGIQIIKNGITPSQLAYNVYKKYYYNINNEIQELPNKLSLYLKSTYTTRPTEVFYTQVKEGYHYDVNSLYPYAMLKEFPIGTYRHIRLKTPINQSELFGFYKVKVHAPINKIKFPILPIKTELNNNESNNLISPVGKWEGWYFSEEIKQATRLGYKFEILEIIHYPNKANIFKEYVNDYYNLKKNAKDPTERKTAKLLLNALYGKFGQNIKEETYKIEIDNTRRNKRYIIFQQDKEFKRSNTTKSNRVQIILNTPLYQISSIITSYARIEMSKIIEIQNKKNNKIIYADVDSIVTRDPIEEKYISDTEIGYLKLVSHFRDGYFLKPKIYTYKDIKTKEDRLTQIYSSSNLDYKLIKKLTTTLYDKDDNIDKTTEITINKPINKNGFPIDQYIKTELSSKELLIQTRIISRKRYRRSEPIRMGE